LWDVCWLLACAMRHGGSGAEVRFAVHVRNDNRDRTPPLVRLKAHCGPGDQGEPVITVMLPEEGCVVSRCRLIPFAERRSSSATITPGPSSLPGGETPRGR